MRTTNPVGWVLCQSSGGTLLAGCCHDYDRIGNKRYQEDLQSSTQSELYAYDTVYRLTSFERGQLNEAKTDITNPTRTQTRHPAGG